MANKYSWPLNVPQFTFWDKVKIAKFLMTDDQWTQGKQVKAFEEAMAKYVGANYAVFVSSGSTANTMLAMYLKDMDAKERVTPWEKKTIVFPSTTWTTSVSPFLREGFHPHFIDINLNDFSMDLNKLELYLMNNREKVACVFVTSLIGMVPDMARLMNLSVKYGVRVMMDNCENTLGTFRKKNVSSFFTSTTSTYFGHQLQSVEGGFLFTNSLYQYDYFLMARNHGMTRALPEVRQGFYSNPKVNSKFDFHMLGNNFRNTDINATIGMLDLKRADNYKKIRVDLYNTFFETLSKKCFYLPEWPNHRLQHVPFCLPIIIKDDDKYLLSESKHLCEEFGVESRPIISGNLLRQTCYSKYTTSPEDFKNSQFLHDYGFYVGLHAKVTKADIIELATSLNNL